MRGGSDTLYDPSVDFSKMDLGELSNLHVLWGGQLAGVLPNQKIPCDPNAGIYKIEGAQDPHRLRISPKPVQNGKCTYSIGRHNYGKFRAGQR